MEFSKSSSSLSSRKSSILNWTCFRYDSAHFFKRINQFPVDVLRSLIPFLDIVASRGSSSIVPICRENAGEGRLWRNRRRYSIGTGSIGSCKTLKCSQISFDLYWIQFNSNCATLAEIYIVEAGFASNKISSFQFFKIKFIAIILGPWWSPPLRIRWIIPTRSGTLPKSFLRQEISRRCGDWSVSDIFHRRGFPWKGWFFFLILKYTFLQINTVDLIPGGRTIPVTNENRWDFYLDVKIMFFFIYFPFQIV